MRNISDQAPLTHTHARTAGAAAVRREVDAINAGISKHTGGKLPALILDAEKRKNPAAEDIKISFNDKGEEVVEVDE